MTTDDGQASPVMRSSAGRYWTVRELAALWRVSERTVRREIAAGHLQVTRIRGSVRITEAERLRYEDEGDSDEGVKG